MQIILYRRSFPVADAPVSVSLIAHAHQRHTFTSGGRVYEAESREIHVLVPDGAKIDILKNLLVWTGTGGPVKSTAKEVLDLAEARKSGFLVAG